MNPSDRPVSRTPLPESSSARRAARTRSTARSSSNSGREGSPVESSIESPAMPVSAASATFSATFAGSTAKPPSKSAFTGTVTADAMARRCASTSSTVTPLSARPIDHANPALVVASAGNPRLARKRALPRSHGLGMTKQPDSCSRRKVWQRSEGCVITLRYWPRGRPDHIFAPYQEGVAIQASSERCRQQPMEEAVQTTEYDAIVVGSGISGGWAAKELTEKGLRVLLLERGKNIEHQKDYVNARKGQWEYPHRAGRTRAMIDAYPVLRRDYPLNEKNLDWWVNEQESPYSEIKRFDWYR